MDTAASVVRSLEGQHVIAFRFAIGQRVYIPDAESWARVRQCCASAAAREYQVSYYDSDKVRRIEWVDESELAKEA